MPEGQRELTDSSGGCIRTLQSMIFHMGEILKGLGGSVILGTSALHLFLLSAFLECLQLAFPSQTPLTFSRYAGNLECAKLVQRVTPWGSHKQRMSKSPFAAGSGGGCGQGKHGKGEQGSAPICPAHGSPAAFRPGNLNKCIFHCRAAMRSLLRCICGMAYIMCS